MSVMTPPSLVDPTTLDQLRREHRIKHPAAVSVDTTLPVDILDRILWHGDRHSPPVTVREHLADVARMAVLNALPSLPARIVDAPLDAPRALDSGCW